MSAASSQLVSLHILADENLWPVLFQLTALTSLSLELEGTGIQIQLPQQRSLPRLVSLAALSACDSAPLVDGAELPSLETFFVPDGEHDVPVSLAGIGSVPKLQDLHMYECEPVRVSLQNVVHNFHLDYNIYLGS